MVCAGVRPRPPWIVHCYLFRLVSTGHTARGDWRRGYVERQLSIARQALCLGSTAAARAALRVLSGEDFVEPRVASGHLRVVRDRSADDDEIVHALHRLCSLEPRSVESRLVETG